ncbi:hypothetical protein COH21_005496 [Aspergillus flavus]|nr:hypothetical protein COH21_005496 [Aspergillus flavus]
MRHSTIYILWGLYVNTLTAPTNDPSALGASTAFSPVNVSSVHATDAAAAIARTSTAEKFAVLTEGASKSSKDYYNGNSTWSSKRSYKAAITLGKTGVPVTAPTNALSREEKCVYTYVVIIGTPSTKAQAAKPASIQGPTSSEAPISLALEGDVAPVPGLGDTIHLPGGSTTVIGHW